MSFQVENLTEAIREAKKKLRRQNPNYARTFAEVEGEMKRQVAEVVEERNTGGAVIPIVQYADIASGGVPDAMQDKIRRRGACVIRQVVHCKQATEWNDELGEYVEVNRLDEKLANAAEDKYFGSLASSKPQIYGIYWSKPQVLARQSESLTNTRVFLNNLWKSESEGRVHFNPNQVPVYADRIRRRPSGAASLGLSPHVDGGSVERWLEENFTKVYRHVFSGDWGKYDAWDAAYRTDVQEIDSPAACSMFRTFQGWTARVRGGDPARDRRPREEDARDERARADDHRLPRDGPRARRPLPRVRRPGPQDLRGLARPRARLHDLDADRGPLPDNPL